MSQRLTGPSSPSCSRNGCPCHRGGGPIPSPPSGDHHRMLGPSRTPAGIMQHDPGLAASPPVRYIMKVERSGCSPFILPSAVDGQPPREAAYGGMQTPRNTSAPPSNPITLLNPLIWFRVSTRVAKQSMCGSICRQCRVGRRRNRPRLRGSRLTFAESTYLSCFLLLVVACRSWVLRPEWCQKWCQTVSPTTTVVRLLAPLPCH